MRGVGGWRREQRNRRGRGRRREPGGATADRRRGAGRGAARRRGRPDRGGGRGLGGRLRGGSPRPSRRHQRAYPARSRPTSTRSACSRSAAPVSARSSHGSRGSTGLRSRLDRTEASALCYCVHTPVAPSTEHWAYDATADHVTADVYVLYPEENPCRDQAGADRVLGCIGDATNLEIFVDIASYHDGADAGLALSEASSEIQLLLEDGSRVLLYENL
ncbi:MAG: hypothetical protein R3B82_19050 [Sandaracinaceae bacterium]